MYLVLKYIESTKCPSLAIEQVLAIVNYSWQHSWVPQKWRTATIMPMLKKGKKPSQVGSNRPIAVTSHLSKCAEKRINARLAWWLEEHKKLSPYQAGYRAGRSTTDQLLLLLLLRRPRPRPEGRRKHNLPHNVRPKMRASQHPMRMLYLAREQEFIDV